MKTSELSVKFEDFDKSKISGNYTRLHYGKAKIKRLAFSFCVYETFIEKSNYKSFSLNFIDGSPDKAEEIGREIIELTKEKLKTK